MLGGMKKVKTLLNEHPELVFSKDENGATPLHAASLYGHKDVVELLLANKADVNARAKDGAAPLYLAAICSG